jgi:hypothetical protein
MPKRSTKRKRFRNVNQFARGIVDEAAGAVSEEQAKSPLLTRARIGQP